MSFTLGIFPWSLPTGFVPLLQYSATVGESAPWMAEAPLAPAPTPMMR